MFKNHAEDEVDFCEAYKSQILNGDEEDKESPIGSILIILLLLAAIIALSIFGYNYITKSSSTIPDEELKVTQEESTSKEFSKKESNTQDVEKVVIKSLDELPKSKSVDIDELADKVKIDMSQNEEKNNSYKDSSDSKYVESLAQTTKSNESNIDESNYIRDLEALTKEIDKERE